MLRIILVIHVRYSSPSLVERPSYCSNAAVRKVSKMHVCLKDSGKGNNYVTVESLGRNHMKVNECKPVFTVACVLCCCDCCGCEIRCAFSILN